MNSNQQSNKSPSFCSLWRHFWNFLGKLRENWFIKFNCVWCEITHQSLYSLKKTIESKPSLEMSAVSISSVKCNHSAVKAIAVTHHRPPPSFRCPSSLASLSSTTTTSLHCNDVSSISRSKLLPPSRLHPIKSSPSPTPSLGTVHTIKTLPHHLNIFSSSFQLLQQQIHLQTSWQSSRKQRRKET